MPLDEIGLSGKLIKKGFKILKVSQFWWNEEYALTLKIWKLNVEQSVYFL